ncbi:MAG TPA: hypothetical protein VFS43_28035 [Polyangiaceae bacterium]|nr:hypothetical protein [Polyangiaceae bacterium]
MGVGARGRAQRASGRPRTLRGLAASLARALASGGSGSLLAAALVSAIASGCSGPPPARPPRPARPPAAAPSPCPPEPPALERDASVPGRRFAYGLHLAPLPNLLYQLDCVSGAVVCARVVFREFWGARGLDAGDEAALSAWKALRTRHGGELKRLDVAPVTLPLLAPAGAFDLGERQRLAGLLARAPGAYEASIALLSADADARRLGEIVRRFEPRFLGWWRSRGFAAGSASFDAFARRLADPFFDATLERAARFYEAELPPGPLLDVHLVVQPASPRQLTAAFQLERYAIVEAPEGRPIEGLLGVVAHEAFHYFFSRMPNERKAALIGRVVASDDPFAAASYGVFDEAVARALGNGVVAQHYEPPESFARSMARNDPREPYREASAVGRALFPSMAGFLERGASASSDEFVRAYLAAARSTYEGGRPRPLDYLHAPVLVADPRFAAAAERLRDASNAGFPTLREYAAFDDEARGFVGERPFVSAALLVPAGGASAALDGLAAPAKHRAAMAALAGRARGFVYALPRTPKSYAFVFAAGDVKAMGELVERFVALSAMREGALVELAK